jgi:hypothetical protein
MKSFKIPSLKPIRFKKPYRFVLGGLLIAYALNSCSLFGEPDPTLPPETQTGANTFGCLVNNKIVSAKGSDITLVYDGRVALFVDQGKDKSYTMGIVTPILNGVGDYIFDNTHGIWYTGAGWNWYGKGNKPVRSKLVITKFERGEDKANNLRWLIVAGTFEGVLLPEKNAKDTLYITEGRFDVKFN